MTGKFQPYMTDFDQWIGNSNKLLLKYERLKHENCKHMLCFSNMLVTRNKNGSMLLPTLTDDRDSNRIGICFTQMLSVYKQEPITKNFNSNNIYISYLWYVYRHFKLELWSWLTIPCFMKLFKTTNNFVEGTWVLSEQHISMAAMDVGTQLYFLWPRFHWRGTEVDGSLVSRNTTSWHDVEGPLESIILCWILPRRILSFLLGDYQTSLWKIPLSRRRSGVSRTAFLRSFSC